MNISPEKLNRKFTYKDYLLWSDNERWELIDGIAFNMSPTPSRRHQDISLFFSRLFGNFLEGKDCRVYAAPFDVRLSGEFKASLQGSRKSEVCPDEDIDTVVQPDISVFCDENKLDDRGAVGTPDLVIEILSLSTASKDLKEKFFLYEKSGVREYWIVDPANKTLTVFKPGKNGSYSRGVVYAGDDLLRTDLFDGLEVKLAEVFVS